MAYAGQAGVRAAKAIRCLNALKEGRANRLLLMIDGSRRRPRGDGRPHLGMRATIELDTLFTAVPLSPWTSTVCTTGDGVSRGTI